MRRLVSMIAVMGLIFGISVGVTACKKEGTMEQAGKAADEAVESVGEAAQQAGEKAEEAAEAAKEAVQGEQ